MMLNIQSHISSCVGTDTENDVVIHQTGVLTSIPIGNFGMDALQCAPLPVELLHKSRYALARQANATFYLAQLQASKGLTLPIAADRNGHIWNRYALLASDSNAQRPFSASGIVPEIYHPPSAISRNVLRTCLKSCFRLPKVSRTESSAFPFYAEVTKAERADVVAALTSFHD